jgi:hypothetical protein
LDSDELLRAEKIRRDIAAYEARPSTEEQIALARRPLYRPNLVDETDWEALYS